MRVPDFDAIAMTLEGLCPCLEHGPAGPCRSCNQVCSCADSTIPLKICAWIGHGQAQDLRDVVRVGRAVLRTFGVPGL